MSLMRWHPHHHLDLDHLEQEFNQTFGAPLVRRWPRFRPIDEEAAGEIDVYEKDQAFVVKAFLPGVKPEDIQVTAADHTIEIAGESRQDEEVQEGQVHRQEHRYGKFLRRVALPVSAETAKANADFDNGVLTVTVPKTEAAQTKAVSINVTPSANAKDPS